MRGHREHHGGRGFDLNGGAEPPALDDPRQIGPFTLIGLLGAGGMGRAHLEVASGRYDAVKRGLPPPAEDPDFPRHFRHELDHLAGLPAGVGVPLPATDRTAKPPWFVTGYIPGLALTEAPQVPLTSICPATSDAVPAIASIAGPEKPEQESRPGHPCPLAAGARERQVQPPVRPDQPAAGSGSDGADVPRTRPASE